MVEKVHTWFEDETPARPNTSTSNAEPNNKETSDTARRGKTQKKSLADKHQNDLLSSSVHRKSSESQTGSRKTKPVSLSERRNALIPFRRALPIWKHSSTIRESLQGAKDVLLLVGETGSGKSTQVPQFLLTESWCKRCIGITQPRRVAAISLAKRVAEEMGTPLGSSSPASKVGYSVRFDYSVSPGTRIKFLTEGMLLQEMLRDPSLSEYSAIVLDEVHERSVNMDLLLGMLRNLVTQGKKTRQGEMLKLVVMSATAEMERLHDFFTEGFQLVLTQVNGPEIADEDNSSQSSWSGISTSSEEAETVMGGLSGEPASDTFRNESQAYRHDLSRQKDREKQNPQLNGRGQNKMRDARLSRSENNGTNLTLSGDKNPIMRSDFVTSCFIEGRKYPVSIMYLPEPTLDWVEAALKSILQVHAKEPLPGDILVFLTGQDVIEALEQNVNEYAQSFPPELPKLLVLPLFAALPQSAQQRVFVEAPANTRKVILSTNIAETSVTVPGVRFVIDSGKAKIKQFNTKLGLDTLLSKPISKSAAIQRKGRAGREAPGACYRLYTEEHYLQLQEATTPEILRCDLGSAVLGMKARGIDDVFGFPFLDQPPREAIEKALLQLYHVGALTEKGLISEIGGKMAKLPLSPMLGRALVEAALPRRDCLAGLIDIVACLSVENIFLSLLSEEKKEQAEEARRSLFRREGDHMTLLTTVQAYAAEETDRRGWAERHYVSHRAMQRVMDIRKQLRKLLNCSNDAQNSSSETSAESLLKCLLSGFVAQTAVMLPDGSYKTSHGNQPVTIHPSSVLFGKRVEAIMFTEWVYTNKSYARGVSAVEMQWVEDALASRG